MNTRKARSKKQVVLTTLTPEQLAFVQSLVDATEGQATMSAVVRELVEFCRARAAARQAKQ